MLVTTPDRLEGPGVIAALRRLPSIAVATVVVVLLLLVAWLDRTTGSAPAQHIYYLPIVLAGIRFTRRGAVAAALSAVLLYHLANPSLLRLQYREADFVQVVLFMAVSLITAKLTEDARRLHRLAMTDDLTGLHNLRSFEDRLGRMLIERGATSVALLILDVDRLKSLNDRYGHLAGADAVRTVGHLIAAWSPPEAVACRYGGDEFAVAVPDCGTAQATRLAEHLRHAINEAAPVLAGQAFPAGTLSISVGVACTRSDHDDRSADTPSGGSGLDEWLFRSADAELYRAKSDGRNQTRVA